MIAKILDVYFHNELIGKLEQDKYGETTFVYSENWINSLYANHRH